MSASKVFLALTFAAVLIASSAQAAFTVSTNEIWDGVSNPHSADGVTMTVVGTNPAVVTYNIPTGMTIDPGVTVFLKDPSAPDAANNKTITWNFTGAGGLTFGDVDSTIDLAKGTRVQPARLFTLNMNNNPISGAVAGAGRIVSSGHVVDFLATTASPANNTSRDSWGLTINSMNNVTIGTLDVTNVDAARSALTVNAHGTVDVDNLANADLGAAGGNAAAINISGGSLIIGNINGQSVRNISTVAQSAVNLNALAQPANSTGNFNGNTFAANAITLDGFINLAPPMRTDNPGGNVTLNSVKTTLTDTFGYSPNATSVANAGIFTINAGRVQTGFTEAQMFVNNSFIDFPDPDAKNFVNFNVFHDGVGPPAVSWLANASGNWNTDANWTPGVAPNNSNTVATIGSVITAPQTLFMESASIAKGIVFDTASKVALAGTAVLTLESNSGNSSLSVLQGSHEVQVPVTLGTNTDFSAAAGTSVDFNDVLNLNGKTLNVSGDGTVNLNNSVTGVGAVNNSGTLGTGGSTSLAGTLTSTGTLAIDIGGAGTNFFDAWNVTGAATLSGTLSVDLVGGFTPSSQSFTVLTASSVSAASLTLGGPDAGMFTLIKNANSLVLQPSEIIPVAGDYNENGIVDAADYVLWREQDGDTVAAGTGADGDGNGVVNTADYTFWRARFGNTSASGSSVGAVPEPTSAALVLLAGLALAAVGRRR